MNGQERSNVLSSNIAGSNSSVNNGVPTGAVKGSSWPQDMISDPARAAQAGIVNPRQNISSSGPGVGTIAASHFDPSSNSTAVAPHGYQRSSFSGVFPFTNSLFQGLQQYNGATLGSMMPPMQVVAGDPSMHPLCAASGSASTTEQLLVSAASSTGRDVTSSTENMVFTQPYQMQSRELASASDAETPAKRMKPTDRYSLASQPVGSQHALHSSIPHRPEYFYHGSVIQLGENKLKRIEDLQTSDFETSAGNSRDLSLDCSTVLKIVEDAARGTAFLTFSVGDHKHKPVEATVEATFEHPFFVYDQGWSSVRPDKTLSYYKMRCQQLKVHDRCISLTLKDTNSSINRSFTASNSSRTSDAVSSSIPTNSSAPALPPKTFIRK